MEGPPKRNRNKRKKSFLMNARKYAKQGYYGRGEKLEEETYQYLVRSMEIYREGFPSEEEKHLFANNVFQQTEDIEVTCSSNQVGCRVIETLLPFVNDKTFERYIKIIGDDLRPLCCHRFASHVVSAMLKESTKRSLENKGKQYEEFTTKVSRFLLNNLEDYVWDMYGNHTVRSVLYNLAQIPKEENNNKKDHSVEIKPEIAEIPDAYKEIIKEYGERIINWPQFKEFPLSDITSGFMQVLLKALGKISPKMLKKYLKKLLDECFAPEDLQDENDVQTVFKSNSSVLLLETAIQVATPKLYTQIYAKCFIGKIKWLALNRNTNFAVQKLFSACMEKEEFEPMFTEIEEHFLEILKAGHSGILLAIGQTCKRLTSKQGSFIQSFMKAYDCFKPEDRQNSFVLCMAKALPYDDLPNDLTTLASDKLNLHGTLMIQLMLEFNKPIKIVNSILNLDKEDLKNLFLNSMGSHIVDSFVKSGFVGEKSREKLTRKMQGCYQDLVSSKFGSRSFEALWEASNFKTKMQIMNELSYKDASWSHSQYGKIIAFKINFYLYKSSKEEWQNSLNKKVKSKNLLEDVLGSAKEGTG